MAGLYKSTYSSYTSSTTGNSYGTSSSSASDSKGTDDFKSSKQYGSYDDLHRRSPGDSSPHSNPSEDAQGNSPGYDDYTKGTSASNLGRSGSFRQEWERRRQQKRQTTGTDPSQYSLFNNYFYFP